MTFNQSCSFRLTLISPALGCECRNQWMPLKSRQKLAHAACSMTNVENLLVFGLDNFQVHPFSANDLADVSPQNLRRSRNHKGPRVLDRCREDLVLFGELGLLFSFWHRCLFGRLVICISTSQKDICATDSGIQCFDLVLFTKHLHTLLASCGMS